MRVRQRASYHSPQTWLVRHSSNSAGTGVFCPLTAHDVPTDVEALPSTASTSGEESSSLGIPAPPAGAIAVTTSGPRRMDRLGHA